MTKSLSAKVFVPIIVVVAVFAGFMAWKLSTGKSEFPAPKTSKVIPNYVWNNMKPDMQQKMKAEGYTPGDVQASGQPNTAPTAK